MAKKSIVMVVSYYVVDQDKINSLAQKFKDEGTIQKIFDIPLPGLEKATIKDAHICRPQTPGDWKRFTEILYDGACIVAMEEPSKIYIVKKP